MSASILPLDIWKRISILDIGLYRNLILTVRAFGIWSLNEQNQQEIAKHFVEQVICEDWKFAIFLNNRYHSIDDIPASVDIEKIKEFLNLPDVCDEFVDRNNGNKEMYGELRERIVGLMVQESRSADPSPNITEFTWYRHGKLHRDHDKPAVVRPGPSGIKEWYYRGILHRDGGPAVVQADGTEEFFCARKKTS